MAQPEIDLAAEAPPVKAPAPVACVASTGAHARDEVLATGHLRGNLKRRAASGGLVTVAAQIVRFVLYMSMTVTLARLLVPADFGLVAMVTAITGFLRMFKDAGLSTATVQRETITQGQVSNLFWINVFITAIITCLLAAAAPAIAWFYRDPRLIQITLALSLTFLLSGFTIQHIAILTRQMRFKAIALIDIGSMLIGLLVAVGMALSGAGYWALVGSQLATGVAELVLTWFASSWRPRLPQRRVGTRSLVNFGASLTIANFLRRLAQGADALLIGRFYGAEGVGMYSRALALLSRPLDQFITPFDVVFVPLLSRLHAEPDRYRRTFLKAYGAIALLSFPFAAILLALAGPIVLLLLGPKWNSVTPLFAWLAVAALYIPLGYASMWLLTTQGRSRDILIAGVSFSLISIVSILAGLPFGVLGVAVAYSLGGLLIRLPIQYFITGRSGPVKSQDLWTTFFRYLPVFAAVFAAAYGCRLLIAEMRPFGLICICALCGTIAGMTVVLAIPRQRDDLVTCVQMLKQLVKRSTT